MEGHGNHAPTQYQNIQNSGNTRAHYGHNYGGTVNYNMAPSQSEAQRARTVQGSLIFEGMGKRYQDIYEAGGDAYPWATEKYHTSFAQWLQTDGGIFWVSGKAGSGKSTFMKFAVEQSKTTELLEKWSGKRRLVIAAHCFWYPSTASELQRSLEGLFRTILHDVLDALPLELLPTAIQNVLPYAWSKSELDTKPQDIDWSVGKFNKELRGAIGRLDRIPDTNVALFIDGLDEFNPPDQHGMLVRLLKSTNESTAIKICVSSRPWPIFEQHFRRPGLALTLQDLTKGDMFRFVRHRLKEAEQDTGIFRNFQDYEVREYGDHQCDAPHSTRPRHSQRLSMPLDEPSTFDRSTRYGRHRNLSPPRHRDMELDGLNEHAKCLLQTVVSKAEGVFLWVHLVVEALCHELAKGSDINGLQTYVDAAPVELEPYFTTHILHRIRSSKDSQIWTVLKTLSVLSQTQERTAELYTKDNENLYLSVFNLWVVRESDCLRDEHFAEHIRVQHASIQELRIMVEQTRAFLATTCCDFVDVEPCSDGTDFWSLVRLRVRFLHRSVLDFFKAAPLETSMSRYAPAHLWWPDLVPRVTLARLKIVPQPLSTDAPRSRYHDYYDRQQDCILQHLRGGFVAALRSCGLDVYEDSTYEVSGGTFFRDCCPDISRALMSQYEFVAIYYLQLYYDLKCRSAFRAGMRLHDHPSYRVSNGGRTGPCFSNWDEGYPGWSEDGEAVYCHRESAFTVTFASYGLTGFIKAHMKREPRAWLMTAGIDECNQALLGLVSGRRSADHEKTIRVVLGFTRQCPTALWHRFLSIWFTVNERSTNGEAMQAEHGVSPTASDRFWPIAKLMLSAGADISCGITADCLTDAGTSFKLKRSCQCLRPVPNEYGVWRASSTSARTFDIEYALKRLIAPIRRRDLRNTLIIRRKRLLDQDVIETQRLSDLWGIFQDSISGWHYNLDLHVANAQIAKYEEPEDEYRDRDDVPIRRRRRTSSGSMDSSFDRRAYRVDTSSATD